MSTPLDLRLIPGLGCRAGSVSESVKDMHRPQTAEDIASAKLRMQQRVAANKARNAARGALVGLEGSAHLLTGLKITGVKVVDAKLVSPKLASLVKQFQ